MTPAISTDLKERIVHLYSVERWTMRQISQHLLVSTGLVCKVINLHRNYGLVNDPTKQRTGRPQYLDNADAQYLTHLLESNPRLYLDEIQQKLRVVRNVHVSLATISRRLTGLAFTHKRITKAAEERNEELRMLWRLDMAEYDNPELFVFVDESAVDNHTVERNYGWARAGTPCVDRGTFLRGTRFSILPALSLDGVIALDIFEGSVNKDRFLQFLREHVVC